MREPGPHHGDDAVGLFVEGMQSPSSAAFRMTSQALPDDKVQIAIVINVTGGCPKAHIIE